MGISFSSVKDAAADHPFLLIGGVAAVLLFLQLRKKPAQTTTPSVYAFTADPNQIAASTALSNAQTAAGVAQNQNNNALQLGLAQTAAAQDVSNKQIMSYNDVMTKEIAASVEIAAINAGLQNKTPAEQQQVTKTVQTVGDIQHSLDSAASGNFGGQFGMSSSNPNYSGA